MRLALLLTIGLLTTVFSGCIVVDEDDDPQSTAVRRTGSARLTSSPVPASGEMTADETVGTPTAEACSSGVSVPPANTYCATKVIEVKGTMSDFVELPVSLSTFSGLI